MSKTSLEQDPQQEIEEDSKGYDCTKDTLLHIKRVSALLTMVATELLERSNNHDSSKLREPEKSYFDKYTPKLKGSKYGSEEYNNFLKELKPALDHHYSKNSHHPEHYKNGVDEMNLFDIVEMFVDWLAANERHTENKTDIFESIDYNKQRFKMSDQLTSIFKNTINFMRESFIL
jgi:hypothetical protein